MEKLIQEIVNYQEPCYKEEVLSTGYPELNSLTGGLRRGDLFVIASRPSIGKTAFAIVAQAPNGKNGVVTMQYNPENQQFKIADTCEKL